MSKLRKKAKLKEREMEQSGRKVLLYLGIALVILAILLGLFLV